MLPVTSVALAYMYVCTYDAWTMDNRSVSSTSCTLCGSSVLLFPLSFASPFLEMRYSFSLSLWPTLSPLSNLRRLFTHQVS